MFAAFRYRRRSRGQAFVEFALLLPVMLLILLVAVDFGRLFFSYIQVNNAAREAASYAAIHAADSPFDLAAYAAGADGAAVGETNAQGQRGQGVLTVEAPFCFTPPASDTKIDCDAASNFAAGIGNQVRVRASLPFTFFTPLISGFFGGALPLTASATAPVLNPPVAVATPAPTPLPGSLVVTKTLAGDLTQFSGGDFTFSVSCDGREYGPVTINVASGSRAANAITGIPDGAACTVTETDKPRAGSHADWDNPDPGHATIVTGAQASVIITNTRTYNPPGPGPTPTPTPSPEPCVNPTVTLAPPITSGATGVRALPVTFTGTSTGTPTSWLWDFNDGTTVTTPDTVTHTFTYTRGNSRRPQVWTVTLTVTTGATCFGSATATVTLNP
jgi:Flp pilus assembly protein TadG